MNVTTVYDCVKKIMLCFNVVFYPSKLDPNQTYQHNSNTWITLECIVHNLATS